jgi:uncharacterized membrane protein YcaP (DUF421 family)
MDLTQLIGPSQHEISASQMSIRALIVFIYGLALVRIAGRRIFGRWSALDIVVSVVIGSNLSRAMTGNAPLMAVLVASTLLIAVHWLLSLALAHSRMLSRLIEGKPIHLARDGKLDEKLAKWRGVSEADLHEALRQNGVLDVRETRLITLEPGGKISVIKT